MLIGILTRHLPRGRKEALFAVPPGQRDGQRLGEIKVPVETRRQEGGLSSTLCLLSLLPPTVELIRTPVPALPCLVPSPPTPLPQERENKGTGTPSRGSLLLPKSLS